MHNLIFIVGPTAAGKSDAAFGLAKKIKGQIISCDSMLVYRQVNIVASKPGHDMLAGIKHYFIDTISVGEVYNVFDYYLDATEKIISLMNRGIPVVVCGGSGLYFKALLDGIFSGVSTDPQFRNLLEERARIQGVESLYDELSRVDAEAAKKIKPGDLRRIIRALEVYSFSGLTLSQKKKESKGLWGKIPIKIFGLRFKRDRLYDRVNKRVDQMFSNGAVDEVKALEGTVLSITASKILGVREIQGYLAGDLSLEQAKEDMKKNTRHYAKRQMTWFNADKRVEWIDVDEMDTEDIENRILQMIEN